MRLAKVPMFLALAFLFCAWSVWAQDNIIDREVEIHKNIKLVMLTPAADTPQDMVTQYKTFLPIFEQALKEGTADQSDECALTLRITAGFKEVGAAKVKRPLARVTAFRRNSRQEYVGSFILYSYVTSGPVNKEETGQFLKKQILEPAECRKTE
jgi:hypothetical protein